MTTRLAPLLVRRLPTYATTETKITHCSTPSAAARLAAACVVLGALARPCVVALFGGESSFAVPLRGFLPFPNALPAGARWARYVATRHAPQSLAPTPKPELDHMPADEHGTMQAIDASLHAASRLPRPASWRCRRICAPDVSNTSILLFTTKVYRRCLGFGWCISSFKHVSNSNGGTSLHLGHAVINLNRTQRQRGHLIPSLGGFTFLGSW